MPGSTRSSPPPKRPGLLFSRSPWQARSNASPPTAQIAETVAREELWEAQTPQVFRRQLLLDAYARREGFAATDDAQLVERIGQPVTVVPGSPLNMKITTKEDQRLAEHALKALPKPKLAGAFNPLDDQWR